jgi:hypothetical protein
MLLFKLVQIRPKLSSLELLFISLRKKINDRPHPGDIGITVGVGVGIYFSIPADIFHQNLARVRKNYFIQLQARYSEWPSRKPFPFRI